MLAHASSYDDDGSGSTAAAAATAATLHVTTLPRSVDDVVPLLTAHTLHAYAQAVAAAAAAATAAVSAQQQQQQGDVGSSSSRRVDVTDAAVRTSGSRVETAAELLAPLEVLHGKTFVSAVGIALHDAEPIVRYVEQPPSPTPDAHVSNAAPGCHGSSSSSGSNGHDGSSGSGGGTTLTRARCLYRVGQYTLLSPYYCPCTAYMYQSVRRRVMWCCKHLLALQLVLALEAAAVPPANLRVRIVDAAYFQRLLVDAI